MFSSCPWGRVEKKQLGCKDSLNSIFFVDSDNVFHLLVKYAAGIYPKNIAALSAARSVCEYLS